MNIPNNRHYEMSQKGGSMFEQAKKRATELAEQKVAELAEQKVAELAQQGVSVEGSGEMGKAFGLSKNMVKDLAEKKVSELTQSGETAETKQETAEAKQETAEAKQETAEAKQETAETQSRESAEDPDEQNEDSEEVLMESLMTLYEDKKKMEERLNELKKINKGKKMTNGEDPYEQNEDSEETLMENLTALYEDKKKMEERLNELKKFNKGKKMTNETNQEGKEEYLLDKESFNIYYNIYDEFKDKPLPDTLDVKIINDFNTNIINEDRKELYNRVLYFIYNFLENNISDVNTEIKKSYDEEYILFEDFINASQKKNNYKILKNIKQDRKIDFSYFLLNNI